MKTTTMKSVKFFLVLFIAITLFSCGPSHDERRYHELQDSIQLELDRRELLERANRMFNAPDTTQAELPQDE
jgi:hypothetical protein